MTETDRVLVTKILQAASTGARRSGGVAAGLPPHLLQQSSRRLQVVALLMLGFMLLGWLGGNFLEGELGRELTTPIEWVPNAIIICSSLMVLWVARSSRTSPSTVLTAALIYLVVVSWAIPISQYWNALVGLRADQVNGDLVGISSVSLWMIFITVIVPTRPSYALIALALSGLAVPATMFVLIRLGNAPAIESLDFWLIFVLPYATVVLLAYFSARIVYGLGREVQEATEMGSYQLLDLIGKGGMGEVWRAKHSLLARPAAVKLIHRDALSPERDAFDTVLRRFEREAQVTASLESPHTVALYDFGVSETGSLYYAMELLSGMDLETLVRRFGPLPPERVAHILSQVCRSLGEAHRRGLVHRDVKPANIFVCECAFERDFVKVLDFGLVKRTAVVDGSDVSLASGQQVLVGTPAYLAPELATGKDAVDGRADIYSLGCVAFWLLTGRLPFEESTPIAMIVAHTGTEPTPPSRVAEHDIPEELDTLVLDCLAKDPSVRPASAEDVAARVDATGLAGQWTPERSEKWWRSAVGN